jgi:serine phosphatase RsbU (regulator of sigma subunit)
MAQDTGVRLRMTRTSWCSPAAVLLSCGALALLGISSAAAHPGRGEGAANGPPSSAPPSSGAAGTNGPRHGAPVSGMPGGEAQGGPPPAGPMPIGHGHDSPSPATGKGNAPATGKGSGVGKGDGAGRRGTGKATAATLNLPKVEVPALPRVSVPNLPTPAAPPAPRSTTPAQTTPAAAATEPAAGAPAASAPAASAPAATQPASSATRSRPRRGAGKGTRHSVSRRAHAPRHRTGAVRASARPPRADPVTRSKGAVAVSNGGRRAHGTRAAHRPQAAGQLEPIVKTITKIVGVVPLAVRALIGVLLALALALAVRSRLAALRTRRLEHQRTQLLQDVGLLQAALLPVSPARIGPVGTSVAYKPADGPAAGGDFYDVFALEGGLIGVVLGDVSGHGRQALPHTALLRFTLRAYLEAGLAPRDVLRTAGAVLERQLGESFATVVAATYHPRERILTYACAGHPPPIVTGAGTALAPITACASPPIGTGMQTGARQTVVSLPGSARVCFHTDGITEARTGAELFGTERLAQTVQALEPGSGASALLESVAEQTDARPDDMAACLLTIEGAEEPPRVLFEQLELSRDKAGRKRAERFLAACGVDAVQAAETTGAAQAMVEQGGAALLEVGLADGSPQVALRSENVASLRGPQPARAAVAGVAR